MRIAHPNPKTLEKYAQPVRILVLSCNFTRYIGSWQKTKTIKYEIKKIFL